MKPIEIRGTKVEHFKGAARRLVKAGVKDVYWHKEFGRIHADGQPVAEPAYITPTIKARACQMLMIALGKMEDAEVYFKNTGNLHLSVDHLKEHFARLVPVLPGVLVDPLSDEVWVPVSSNLSGEGFYDALRAYWNA